MELTHSALIYLHEASLKVILYRRRFCYGVLTVLIALFSRDRAPKRRKPESLNSRFDRMIHTVNVIQTPEAEREYKRRRRNSSTSGSSSLAGWEAPKTPMDAYSELEGSRLGPDFSVIKMKETEELKKKYDIFRYPELHFFGSNQDDDAEEVPAWLSNTVATLRPNHPLRDLIPAPNAHISTSNAHKPHEDADDRPARPVRPPSRRASDEEQVFAFCPPAAQPPEPVYDGQMPHPVSSSVDTFDAGDEFALDHFDPGLAARFISPAPFSAPHTSAHEVYTLRESREGHAYVTDSVIDGDSPALKRHPVNEDDIVLGDSPPFTRPGPLARSRVSSIVSSVSHTSCRPSPVPELLLSTHGIAPLPFSTPGPLVIAAPPLFETAARSVSNASAISRGSSSLISAEAQYPLIAESITRRPGASSDSSLSPSDPELLSSPIPQHVNLLRSHKASTNPSVESRKCLSTPAPAARIYFDSPAEDPISSDPLDPADYELDLDYENLDFRWEKFDRGASIAVPTQREDYRSRRGLSETEASDNTSNPFLIRTQGRRAASLATTDEEISDQIFDEPIGDNMARAISSTVFVPGRGDMRLNDSEKGSPANFKDPQKDVAIERPAFNPVPGIHISPLRGSSKSAEGTNQTATEDETNPPAVAPPEVQEEEHEVSKAFQRCVELPTTSAQILEFSLPRTPPTRTTNAAVCTPRPPRRNGVQRSLSIPLIAVLPRTPSRDGVKDPEPSLSQTSNDTIESWSAA